MSMPAPLPRPLAHQLLEERAAIAPEQRALVHGPRTLSYGMLNQSANRLAHLLRRDGVGPEVIVGISLAPCVEMIVAILAVWKAGGAFVPIDPDYPAERAEYIAKRSKVAVLITGGSAVHKASFSWPFVGIPVLRLDENEVQQELERSSPENLTATGCSGRNLAYVIYTSGSTGFPKGVEVEHGALTNFYSGFKSELSLGGSYVPFDALQLAPYTFDAFWNTASHLMFGGTLHLLDKSDAANPLFVVDYIKKQNINTFFATPFLTSMILAIKDRLFPLGRTLFVLVGGEEIGQRLWNELRSLEDAVCFNVYGPTECTVITTMKKIDASSERPVVGKPLRNVSCYVLDENLTEVSFGVPGELYVGGNALARGYAGDPNLTNDRFVYSEQKRERLYRTGDRVRSHPDGDLEFLGRFDHQVKLFGNRVELREVECVLMTHPEILQCVALVRSNSLGKELGVYLLTKSYIGDSDRSEFCARVKEFLTAKLPYYMVPSFVRILEEFPVSTSGKVDRQALSNRYAESN